MTGSHEVEVIPGSVHLVDLDHNVKARHGHNANDADIVLHPPPSDHPDDPLNWSPRRKKLSAFCMAVYVLVTGICSSSLYSILEPLSRNSTISLANLNAGTGYMFLLFGWGCIFWQAIALHYGKRPVYLASLLGTMAVMMWQPYIRTNGQWIAAKILQGFFGAPIEALGEITVSDVFFTHERGLYMAVYALALGYSNGLAPLILGFVNDGQGWQWVFYWCAIFCAAAFLLLFFLMEETAFDRSLVSGRPAASSTHAQTYNSAFPSGKPEEEEIPKATKVTELDQATSNVTNDTLQTTIPPRKSYLAKLKPIEKSRFQNQKQVLRMMLRPLLLFKFPIIVYAGFCYGCNIVWLSVLNATQSLVLSNSPYNMSTSQVGLTFIAPLIGTTLASVYTGFFGNKFLVAMARKNGGLMQAEFRLWLFLASLVLIPFGCILWGVGAYHHIHWFGLVFAMGTISFTTTAGSQISVAYTVDCYRDLAGEALVTVMIIRNTMSFGIGYGVTPWVVNMGYQNAFILGAGAAIAHTLTAFVVIRYGPGLRERSASKYWAEVQKANDKGLLH